MLRFLGRGSAFCDEHNSAVMTFDNELILLDCPMSAFVKLKNADLSKYSAINILVTHTHSDHVSGIAMLIDYEFFIGHIPVTVIAPSVEVRNDLFYLIDRLDGCEPEWCSLKVASEIDAPWLKAVIPTHHTDTLEGRCFGYCLSDGKNDIVYTGDTNTLEPFEPYLHEGTILYTEVSSYKTAVHLFISDVKEKLKAYNARGISVYLMHMDRESNILKEADGTGALPAPLINKEDTI